MMKSVPTQDDWCNIGIDGQHAYKFFFGLDEKDPKLREVLMSNPLERSFDIKEMPEVPFRYYFSVFMKLAGEQLISLADPDFLVIFFLLAEKVLEVNPNRLRYCLDDLIPIMIFVAKNQDFLDADVDIYGDFNEVVNRFFHMKNEGDIMGM